MPEILVAGSGNELTLQATAGQRLSQAIWLSGQIEPKPLCGGLGLCGRCRCRFVANAPQACADELKLFSAAEIAAGWRLACRHEVGAHPIHLELPQLRIPSHPVVSGQAQKLQAAFLGVDLGTTAVKWRAVGKTAAEIASGGFWNPQCGAGADVISRLQTAMEPDGMATLSKLARQALADLLHKLKFGGTEIVRACIAANSAMTEILLQKDIGGLCAAPYRLSFLGNETVYMDLPGCQPLETIFPPLPAPFVGGDISCGILALMERKSPPPFLLADLGTNAELALVADNDRLYLASVPLGPAMEGIGPLCGEPAGPGVITGFALGPAGLEPQIMAGAKTCKGISATGYISLLSILLKLGVMDTEGRLGVSPAMPIAGKIFAGFCGGVLPLPCGQRLSSQDIEMLLKVKAAFFVAIRRIVAASGIAPARLGAFYLAGALGCHADSSQLADLGFIPRVLADKIIAIGNTALEGACILALNQQKRHFLARLCQNAVIIDMANDPDFMDDYLAAMSWGG